MTRKHLIDVPCTESEKGVREIFDCPGAIIYVKDRDLRYLWANQRHLDSIGAESLEAILRRRDTELFRDEHSVQREESDAVVVREEQGTQAFHENTLHDDSEKNHFLASRFPIIHGGSVRAVCCLQIDISTPVSTHGTTEREKVFFQELFENASAMSAVTDAHGFITLINNKAIELFFGDQYTPETLKGRNILEFVHKDDRGKVVSLWKKSMLEKREVSYDIRMITGDGKIKYLLVSGRPIIVDDAVVSFQYQAMDMIDQKIQEQHLLQNATIDTIGQLAGGFAHDFNNLLTVINGYSEIIKVSMDENTPLFSKINQIHQAGNQASRLTQKLLDFSKKFRKETTELDINAELMNQEPILMHLIGEPNRLTISLCPEESLVNIDLQSFDSILINLAMHAKESMDQGEVTITSELITIGPSNSQQYSSVSPGTYVLVSLKHTGKGMSEEMIEQVFDPFLSENRSGKTLGLWTVRNIIKSCGGTLIVERTPETGSCFRMFLPLATAPEKQVTVKTTTENVVRELLPEAKTILVVEDDDTVRELVSEILRQEGHITLTACNGGDALQLARQHDGRIDLLITDMVMRRIDGKMLSKKMLSLWPHVKVMFMSGYGEETIKRSEIGDVVFLQKPFLPGELLEKVHTLLQN
ncbi:MAG TPA: PAS domain-containing sensor histidine kinase [Deltaproteobacteria bacterium]|nr:PAS domain-containing sensor histidine kinase [Deltaproteobacteria bacterium]